LSAQSGALEVAFTAPSDGGNAITSYEYMLNNSQTWVAVNQVTSPFTITGLNDGSTYTVQVRAVGTSGGGISSSPVSAMVGTSASTSEAPGAVQIIPGVGVLEVSFTPPADGGSPIVGYEYTLDGGTTWVTPNPPITSSPFTITGLTSGNDYDVQIRAVNAAGAGLASTTVTVATSQIASPSGVTVTPGSQTLEVSFTAPQAGSGTIANYEYSLDGGTTWITPTPAITSSPFTITNLADGTTLSVSVRARDAANTPGTASLAIPATPGPAPDAPSQLTVVSGVRQLQVFFQMTEPVGNPVLFYEYSTDAGANWNTAAQDTPSSPFTLTDLDDDATYQVRIRAVNAAGAGLPSSTVTAKTQESPLFDAPTNVELAAKSQALDVTFTPPPEAGNTIGSYEYSLDNGQTWVTVIQNTPQSPFTITGLTNGLRYTVVIRAVNQDGQGLASTPVSVTLAAPSPAVNTPRVQTPNGPVFNNGSPPRPGGAPVVHSDGKSAPVTIAPVKDTRPNGTATATPGIRIGSGQLAITLGVAEPDGRARLRDGNTPELAVVRDRLVTVDGEGLLPNTLLRVWLPFEGENARPVAILNVDETGRFAGELHFDARLDRNADRRPLPIGMHVLQLVASAPNGEQVVLDKTVEILQPDPSPERNRAVDALPRFAPGTAGATRGGLADLIRVIPFAATNRARVEGDSWRIALDIPAGRGRISEDSDGSALVELIVNETAQVSGDGFMPATRADIWLFSEPVFLGSVLVNQDGTFANDLPVRDVAPGEHTLQIYGVGADGFIRSANLGVIVLPQTADTPSPSVTTDPVRTDTTTPSIQQPTDTPAQEQTATETAQTTEPIQAAETAPPETSFTNARTALRIIVSLGLLGAALAAFGLRKRVWLLGRTRSEDDDSDESITTQII